MTIYLCLNINYNMCGCKANNTRYVGKKQPKKVFKKKETPLYQTKVKINSNTKVKYGM